MLIGWSKHQVSDDPLQPSRYLLDRAVEKEFADGRGLEVRTPVTELLIGHPAVFQAALKVPKTALRYCVATLLFAVDDIDVAAFNAGHVQSRYAVTSQRNIIARKIAALLVRRVIGSLQSIFFTTIKHQLETLNNDHPDATATEDDEQDNKALRFIAQGLGKGDINGYRRVDRGDDGRSTRDQAFDGALYEGDGGFGADNKRDDADERDATEDGSTARSTGRSHQMVMSAAELARLSRIEFCDFWAELLILPSRKMRWTSRWRLMSASVYLRCAEKY